MHHYILLGQTPVPEPDFERWALWMGENPDATRVALDNVGPYHVSTIFLGLDHGCFWEEGAQPLLFETMIFADDKGDELHMWQWRSSTWSEAEADHARAVEQCRAKIRVKR